MHIPANRLETLIELSVCLDAMERHPERTSADQYQAVVHLLKSALAAGLPEYAVQPVLDAHPATAEIHENMGYARWGLSRAPLHLSIGSAIVTMDLLERVAGRTRHINE